ncbi:MAG: hypothetical protein J4F28_06960 [Nitrosopumilaceae archaeon]|nr:hypothetical protein [Nitrosopumilaceae archaeon]
MEERYFAIGTCPKRDKVADYLEFGEVYKSALKTLMRHFEMPDEDMQKEIDERTDPGILLLPDHDYGIAPLAFLFRHYIEIKLKGLILYKGGSWEPTHDVRWLLEQLKNILNSEREGGDNRLSAETCIIINEFQKLDKNSDGFRYPYGKKGDPSLQNDSALLKYFNSLSTFKQMVNYVVDDFTNLEGDIDAEKECRETLASMSNNQPS